MDYFSLYDILVEEERVPVEIQLDTFDAHHIDGTVQHEVSHGAKLQLPLWIARSLYSWEFVNILLPEMFSASIQHSLAMDADSVSIRPKSNFYWELGMYLSGILEDSDLSVNLFEALVSRSNMLLQRSITEKIPMDEYTYFELNISEMEKRILEKSRLLCSRYEGWRTGANKTIRMNEYAATGVKRTRNQ